MTTEVDPISGADMDAQLTDTFANRFVVAEVPSFDLAQANANSRLRHLVANGIEPFRERLVTIFASIAENFDQGKYCSL